MRDLKVVTDEQRKRIKDKSYSLSEVVQSARLDFSLDLVIDNCINFCNRLDIPVLMERAVISICVRVLLKDGNVDAETNISSRREGDMTLTYSTEANIFDEKNILLPFVAISGIRRASDVEPILD